MKTKTKGGKRRRERRCVWVVGGPRVSLYDVLALRAIQPRKRASTPSHPSLTPHHQAGLLLAIGRGSSLPVARLTPLADDDRQMARPSYSS